jgi:hypothetical protein
MISIISKSAYGFQNPNKSMDLLVHGLGNSNAPKLEDAYYTTKASPNEIQQAPEWIKGDAQSENPIMRGNAQHWANARKDWDKGQGFGILEVQPVVALNVPAVAATPVAQNGQEVDLRSMSKAELIAHAGEVHGLDLDPSAKKDELIAAIEDKKSAAA